MLHYDYLKNINIKVRNLSIIPIKILKQGSSGNVLMGSVNILVKNILSYLYLWC